MGKLSVDQALLKAKSHAKKGEIAEAQKLYQAVLEAFPKNKRAQQGLAALNTPKQSAATQGPPQETINQLINLYNQGLMSAVVEQAQALKEQYPEAFIIWNILGAANKGLGRVQAASEAFRKVTELNPTYADGFSNLGTCLQEQGKLDEAIGSYKKALLLKPDYVEAHYNMGIALQDQGKREEAIEAYNKALSLKPNYAEVYNNMGNVLKEQGKLAEATEAYNKALSLKPGYAEAYTNMGVTLKKQGKLEEAIGAYNKALLLKPDYAEAYTNMGVALQEQGKLEEAIEAYNKTLLLKPDYAEAYYNLGVTVQDQGKLEEAIASYEKALKLKPDYAEAYTNMGVALQEQGKPEEAIEAYKKALAIKPDNAEAYTNMGVALQKQGKLEEAIASFEKALTLKPDYAEAYYNLGVALQDQGKLEEAIASYEKALTLKPDYAEAYTNMGVALQEQGKLEEAIASFEKALTLKPDYAEAYTNMGVALQEQGKLEEAIASFEKALKLKPHYADAYYNTVELLKLHSNVSSSVRGLIDIDRQSKEFGAKLFVSSTDQEIAAIVSETLGFINRAEFKFKTPGSQLYKRNTVDLNCSRHTKIFDQKSIIPEFCFGCFKVQVEVSDLFSLIKLSKLFYDLNFETDLTRKTMIEMRPEIPGFYKGLFYCRGLKQARNVKETLDADLNFTFGGQIVSKIKRGCSEFPLKFPDYGKIKNDREVEMDFPIDWKPEEDQFDQDTLIKPKENLIPSRSEFSLSDFYIIQKWIDYSKGLNDPSCEWFEDLPIVFPNVYDIAVDRKTKFGKVF